MIATVHRLRPSLGRLECSSCGVGADAACDCGAPYLPAGARAAAAVAANPEKSDRALAAELGVDHKTVGKARRSTGEHSPVDKRVGQDGKTRKLPKPRVADDVMPTDEEAEEDHQAALLDQACLFLELMTDATRRKLFAHMRKKYNGLYQTENTKG